MQYNNKQNPRIISKNPEGLIFFKEIKNHKLYKIQTEHIKVIKDKVKKLKFKLI